MPYLLKIQRYEGRYGAAYDRKMKIEDTDAVARPVRDRGSEDEDSIDTYGEDTKIRLKIQLF